MDLLPALSGWAAELRIPPEGSTWLHHTEFAERTEHLSGHLTAVLQIADLEGYPSALCVVRTALEHHVIDRLILLADRYVETVRPDDPADIDQWERDWEARRQRWTKDVVSIERTKDGRGLRLVRSGHSVRDDAGEEHERISPYWVTLEHHDAFLGHPNFQQRIARPFSDPDERAKRAQRNQRLYTAYLRWSSLCSNLELNELASPAELLQLQVHYGFLSAFTHATKSGYEVDHRVALPNAPSSSHVFGELALLYVSALAIAQIDAWDAYIARRPHLLMPLRPELREQVETLRQLISYFWFLVGEPQTIDYFDEANKRAHPVLMSGTVPTERPEQLQPDDVAYYANPFVRLRRLHVGEREITTGYWFPPMWSTLHW